MNGKEKGGYRVALVSGGAGAYHSIIATGLIDALKKSGNKLIWYQSLCKDNFSGKPYETGEMNIYNLINYELVDVVVMLTITFKDSSIKDTVMNGAKKAGIPVISVDREIEGAYNITMGYNDGLEYLIRHVIEDHKAKTIGFMAGFKGLEVSDEREALFRRLLTEYNLPINEGLIGYGYFWHEGAYNIVDEWYKRDGRLPDAIICSNDSMAIGACNKVSELGFVIPDDIIITGLDGIEEALTYTPKITTAKLNISKLVQRISELIEPVCRGEAVIGSVEVIEAEIDKGQSCGCDTTAELNNENSIKHRLYDEIELFKNSARKFITLAEEIDTDIDFNTAVNGMSVFLNKAWSKKAWLCIFDDFVSDISSIDEENHNVNYRRTGYTERLGFVLEMTGTAQGQDGVSKRIPPFETKRLIPDLDEFFKKYTGLTVLPLHFQDRAIGYLAMEVENCLGNYNMLHSIDCNVMGMVLENARIQHELKNFAARLEQLHIRDPMTNLYNRRGFYRYVPKIYEQCAMKVEKFMIISADLDELKEINDIYGHSEGDNAIIMIARALEAASGNNETIARFGGDEYIVAGACPSEEYGNEFIKKVNQFIDNYNKTSGKPYTLRTSCGIYMAVPDRTMSLDEFISTADRIMYDEKMSSKLHRGVSRRRM